MGSDMHMPTPPDGRPRFVALSLSAEGARRVVAEAPSREPVDHAVTEMTLTVQARGGTPTFEVWGPATDGSGWQHIDTVAPGPGVATSVADATVEPVRSAREERLRDRRHQVLTSTLASAGVPIGQPEDDTAIRCLIGAVDEDTIRRLAHWFAQATAQS